MKGDNLLERRRVNEIEGWRDAESKKEELLGERDIYAEVVTFVAGSLEAGGLPVSLEVLVALK